MHVPGCVRTSSWNQLSGERVVATVARKEMSHASPTIIVKADTKTQSEARNTDDALTLPSDTDARTQGIEHLQTAPSSFRNPIGPGGLDLISTTGNLLMFSSGKSANDETHIGPRTKCSTFLFQDKKQSGT